MPAVESLEAARHFRLGPRAYGGAASTPWKNPITGPYYHWLAPHLKM